MKNDKLINAQMKEISRLQVLASKQVAEIHAKEMLIRSLVRGKKKQEAEIVEDKIIIKDWMADSQRLTEELVKLKDVISKGTDMKVELLKENAKLKELVREQRATFSKNCLKGFATMCRKCYKDDEVGGCERKRWLAKAKQALGEGKE